MAGKQDHLLAGKKKLEEFRKKKAAEKAEKAKKTTVNSHSHPAGAGLQEKQSLESDPIRVADSDGAGTSYGSIETSGKNINSDNRTDLGSSTAKDANTIFSTNNYNVYSLDPFQTSAKDEKFRNAPTEEVNVHISPDHRGTINNHAISSETSARLADGIVKEHIMPSFVPSLQDSGSSSKHSNYGLGLSYTNDSDTRMKDTADSDTYIFSEEYKSNIPHKSNYKDLRASDSKSFSSFTNGGIDERKFSSSVGHLTSASSPFNSKESGYSSANFDGRNPSSQVTADSFVGGTNTRRSRPSFLDSINTSRISSAPIPQVESQNVESSNSEVNSVNAQAASASQDSINAFGSSNGHHLFRHDGSGNNFDSTHSFYSTKQNEDFAALEQHIEDLTQEKFSLQRALEASRTLAESLASENSALRPFSSPDIELLEKNLCEVELERDWRDGVGVRRKKRRKRRGFEGDKDEYGDVKQVFSRSRRKAGQHLSSEEEAEYILLIKEEAKLEAARRKILETTKHDPTLSQLADVVGVPKSRLDKILCGGRESRQRITESYKRLVVSIASSYQGRGLNMQDLVQEGSIGLLRGVKKFNPEKGFKLSTYVYWWIRQAISKAVASKSRTIRLPGSVCEVIPKIAEANNSLAVRLRRPPSFEEIAKSVGTTVKTVRLIYQSSKEPVSLDQAMTSQGCMSLQDIMPGPEELTPESMLIKQHKKQELEKILNQLSDRESIIVRLYYGLDGKAPRSFEEIGNVLKLSRERIRQINGTALSKLKQNTER